MSHRHRNKRLISFVPMVFPKILFSQFVANGQIYPKIIKIGCVLMCTKYLQLFPMYFEGYVIKFGDSISSPMYSLYFRTNLGDFSSIPHFVFMELGNNVHAH